MHYNVGRGIKGSLRQLHEKDENGETIRIHLECQSIEEILINFNTNHFSKVFHSEIYKDKIYSKLEEEEMRNKIIVG